MSETTITAICASCFWITGGCQWSHELHCLYRHGILHLLSEGLSPLLPERFEGISRIWSGRQRLSFCPMSLASVARCWINAEPTGISFRTLSLYFPPIALSHFPLNVNFLSCLTLGYYSSLHNLISDSEVSRPHRLINLKSNRCLQSWTTRLSNVSDSFLVVRSQDILKLNRIQQFWLVQYFQDHFRWNLDFC